jgi:K+-sensing histidine kinase KdpD
MLTPEGGSVGLTARMDQAGVLVSVANIGVGAALEESPGLGSRIAPIESPPGEQREDAGLGMALANRLLEMHGGCIHVETGTSGVSTFVATIPLNRQNEEIRTDAA